MWVGSSFNRRNNGYEPVIYLIRYWNRPYASLHFLVPGPVAFAISDDQLEQARALDRQVEAPPYA